MTKSAQSATRRIASPLVLAAFALATGLSPAHAVDPVEARPVMVGDDNGYSDGCSALGYVAPLNPKGDNFLAVRATPSVKGAMTYKLKPGHVVWLCDQTNDGKWHGVVFQAEEHKDEYFDCGVTSPMPFQPYRGPCRKGWVSAKFILMSAG